MPNAPKSLVFFCFHVLVSTTGDESVVLRVPDVLLCE